MLGASCSWHDDGDLIVGQDRPGDGAAPKAGQTGRDGARAGSAGANAVAAGGTGALAAAIEDREGVALDVVTVTCAGECFEVVAVASGGYPPYAFAGRTVRPALFESFARTRARHSR